MDSSGVGELKRARSGNDETDSAQPQTWEHEKKLFLHAFVGFITGGVVSKVGSAPWFIGALVPPLTILASLLMSKNGKDGHSPKKDGSEKTSSFFSCSAPLVAPIVLCSIFLYFSILFDLAESSDSLSSHSENSQKRIFSHELRKKSERSNMHFNPSWVQEHELLLHGLAPPDVFTKNLDPSVGGPLPSVQEVYEKVPEFDGVSVVIPAKFEEDFIVFTIKYLFDFSPPSLLREIIVIDDQSELPIEEVIKEGFRKKDGDPDATTSPAENPRGKGVLSHLTSSQRRKVRVLRLPRREGLIRGKIIGADASEGSHILFLDGHCRVVPGYLERMLLRLGSHWRRIIVPIVPTVLLPSWDFENYDGGSKMMFRWSLEFEWYEDESSDNVPVSSGGILLMSKRWWEEGGRYDEEMQEWGGENIEQSLRTWMCGGEVIVEREAKIGHIYDRPLTTNKTSVNTVPRNLARAAIPWMDEYLPWFLDARPGVSSLLSSLGPGLGKRLSLRENLKCSKFSEYRMKFWKAFETVGLQYAESFRFRHVSSGLCVTVDPVPGAPGKDYVVKVEVLLLPCVSSDPNQRFLSQDGGVRMLSQRFRRCLDRGSEPYEKPESMGNIPNDLKLQRTILFRCSRKENENQNFMYFEKSKRVAVIPLGKINKESEKNGTNILKSAFEGAEFESSSLCLLGPIPDGKPSKGGVKLFHAPCELKKEGLLKSSFLGDPFAFEKDIAFRGGMKELRYREQGEEGRRRELEKEIKNDRKEKIAEGNEDTHVEQLPIVYKV